MTKSDGAQTSPMPGRRHGHKPWRSVLAQVGSLLHALGASPERRRLIWLTAGIIAVLCAIVVGQVRLNVWQGDFYDALEQRHFDAFLHQVGVFLVIVSVLLTLVVSQTWLQEMIKVRLREWMTHDLLDEWLAPKRAYRMQFAGEIGVNPDQRMQEDARHLTELSASLGVGFLQASLLLVSFLGVLWVLSEQVVFVIGGSSFYIPGYMVWCALAFASAGSWLSWRVGRPLIQLNYDRYSAEADLRFALVRDSENAEGIAVHRGESDERHLLDATVDRLIDIMRQLANGLARLTWITSGYGWLALVAPILIASPGYFGGNLSFGGLMMVMGAFNQVQSSLRWFVDNFAGIADWRATLSRIVNFRDALLAVEQLHHDVARIETSESPAGNLTLDNVTLYLPSGRAALDAAHVSIAPGEHILIVGGSGSGKTALVLAFAGLWPWGTGAIGMPPLADVLFLRERPYLPLGTLRAAIAYPEPAQRIDDATISAALTTVGLAYLQPSLDRQERWDRILSLDEQQRLVFARLLLCEPKWVFLDDVLSAIDKEERERLMSIFNGPLAGTAVISTSRTPERDHFYNRTFNLRRLPGDARLPVAAKGSSDGAAASAMTAHRPAEA
jgi:vitamin B12/bleomycin/antimicrobial peptide transport system ATP-binding/permease protein